MCMGPTHAAIGLAAGVATLPAAPVHDPAGQLAWVAVVGGMAMLPDADHPSATVARMWGPVTAGPVRFIHRVARGHRWGTHDVILAPALFGLAAQAAAGWIPSRMLLVALAIGLALRACNVVIPGKVEMTVLGNLAISWGAAWWLCTNMAPGAVAWLPQAVIVGVLAHLLGDFATKQGLPIPIAWIFIDRTPPKKGRGKKVKREWWQDGRMELPSAKVTLWLPKVIRRRGRFPRLRLKRQINLGAFETGHTFERYVVLPGAVAAIVLLTLTQTQLVTAARAAADATHGLIVAPTTPAR